MTEFLVVELGLSGRGGESMGIMSPSATSCVGKGGGGFFCIPNWRRGQMPHEQFERSRFRIGKVEQLAFAEYDLVAIIIALDDSSMIVIHE